MIDQLEIEATKIVKKRLFEKAELERERLIQKERAKLQKEQTKLIEARQLVSNERTLPKLQKK